VIKTTSGTVVHLVPHFHMDPVWWNTQSASIDQLDTSDWSGSPRMGFQRSALDVMDAHLVRAERDPGYRFCVAEVDYLEPFWFHRPHQRDRLARLIAAGRVEVVGATYNEPNTNLVAVELVRRNLLHGLRFQRGVLGASVEVAWQIDVFGHDPSFPSVLASAGIGAAVFARGPFRPWGPLLDGGFDTPTPTARRLFPSEFEWIAPDGTSVLGVYLAGHYSAGYQLDRCDDVAAATSFVESLVDAIGPLAATNHVIIPIGTDLGPPSRWVTEVVDVPITLDGAQVVVSTPSGAIAAIVEALGQRAGPSPQSRDMNPVYTGKDVSYIDTKQAHRACEHLLFDAEVWSTMAMVLAGSPYPASAIDDAWRLLVYASHHDALTGTESDQVYVDLLTGWRRAHHLALGARDRAIERLAGATDTSRPGGDGPAFVVFSSTVGVRRDVATVVLGPAVLEPLHWRGLRIADESGNDVTFVAETVTWSDDGYLELVTLSVLVDIEGIGTRTFHVEPSDEMPTWEDAEPDGDLVTIVDGERRLTADPKRGGCVVSWTDREGRELVTDGRLANELAVYPEYATHPVNGEGPWHLSPSGPPELSSEAEAHVVRSTSPIGERLVISCSGRSAHTSTLTLWRGVDRVDGRVVLASMDGSDHLVRLRWPVAVPGSRPVFETGEAVIGRGFAHVDVDAAEHPWTLDTPASNWFANSVCARVVVGGASSAALASPLASLAFGVAEVVIDSSDDHGLARSLVVALAASGVTATCTLSELDRYGSLDVDSNAPDVRVVVGIAGSSPLVDEIIGRLDPGDAAALASLLALDGGATWLWCGQQDRNERWVPGLDVRGVDDLPVVLVTGRDQTALASAVAGVVTDLADHVVAVPPTTLPVWVRDQATDDRTVAIVNRGVPGGAVTLDGTLHLSLQRACTAWPSGQWIDPPRVTVPDGSSFQLQHWTHEYDYALVARPGDWRSGGIVRSAVEFQRPLVVRVETRHSGSLAPSAVLVAVDDPAVEIRAVLPTERSASRPAVTIRCSETTGRRAQVELSTGFATSWQRIVDLLGVPSEAQGVDAQPRAPIRLGPYQCVSVELGVDPSPSPVLGERRGLAVFSPWWTQSLGPRLTSTGTVAVSLHRSAGVPFDQWAVSLAHVPRHVDRVDDESDVDVELVVDAPEGWLSGPSTHHRRIGPGGYEIVVLDICVPDEPPSGHHVVRATARCSVDDGPSMALYDERVVSVGAGAQHVSFVSAPDRLSMAPGEQATASWSLRNDTDVELVADVEVLSPWGTWDWFEHRRVVSLAPHDITEIEFAVKVGRVAVPGEWWWLARAAIGPCVLYSPSGVVTVDA